MPFSTSNATVPPSPPDLNIPASSSVVSVSIINTTTRIHNLPTSLFMRPSIPGHSLLAAPAFSFLIRHPKLNRSLIFDLGVRKDMQNLPPAIQKGIIDGGAIIKVEKNVRDILDENGIDVDGNGERPGIEAVIWSHWHVDHAGDPSTFPSSTNLVVGPGFKDKMLPGYPANPESTFLEADYAGRDLVELDPSSTALNIGGMTAWDYFGDGSFYLLDTPGHAVGHICGLARVTSRPDSFILMGGDICHHNGELRPSAYLPLPESIIPDPFAGFTAPSHSCPGSLFKPLLRNEDPGKPFYEPDPAAGIHFDLEQASTSIEKIQKADCRDNILVASAHDETLLSVCDFFPKTMDQFMEKGWVGKLKWLFLRDFTEAVGWRDEVKGKGDWTSETAGIGGKDFWKTFVVE